MADSGGAALLLASFGAILTWLSDWNYRRLPRIPANPPRGPLPSLTIIVPARDEAHNLPDLLGSLAALSYPGEVDIIVVDDQSTDGTAQIARAFDVRVLPLETLPTGWLGKPHACHQGARLAQGEWLLFTDADTVHSPIGPAEAVAWAAAHQVDGLSAFLAQRSNGFWDRLPLALAFSGLFTGWRESRPFLNGQYILVQRRVYESSGGFAAVRDELLEDLALGHHLRGLGFQVPTINGESLAQVHMYRGPDQLWQGLTRVTAGSLGWSGWRGLLPAGLTAATAAPLLWVIIAGLNRRRIHRATLSWVGSVAGLLPWARRFRLGPEIILAPVGGLFVLAAAVWGVILRVSGRRGRWKGRKV